ncbi:Histidine kinase-, DNA gyrase B-, and HSP90-like ATPase [Flavobacterium saccharophilum]|uniref:histidine kinase n=1 Tax=Flavobacterium saccharophilum TaxID=29534 RepID=A0A1M6ZG47_9FLAO|nr:Histidine kinase-, DNA gyrase B-, and HSP90-like ATPase [Flavobacterium saccharophilum]
MFFSLLSFLSCTEKINKNDDSSSGQDSLKIYLSLAEDDKLPLEYKIKYSERAYELVSNQTNDSLNRVNFFKVANRFYNNNHWNSFKRTVLVVLNRAQAAKDSVFIAKSYTYLGDYYSTRAISDSAYMFYFKAEKIYFQLKDNSNLATTRLSKAYLQYAEGDLLGSEKAVFNVLKVLDTQKNAEIVYESYNLLGAIYNDLEEYDKALEFHNKALSSVDSKVIPAEFQSKATSLNNIGYVYNSIKNYKRAKDFYEKALKEKNLKTDKPSLYAMLIDNLAYAKFKLLEKKDLPDMFYRSLKFRDSLKLTSGLISNKLHLSEFYAFNKDTAKAMKFSVESLRESKKMSNSRNVLQSLKQLALIDPKKASLYSEEYIRINDSLQKGERQMGDKFTRIEYETNEIKDQNSNLQEKNRALVYVFSICTLLGLFFYVYKTQQAKHRELLFKQEQQIANENIYNLMISQQNDIEMTRIKEKKRVAQELHDGVLGRMFGVRISMDSLDSMENMDQANAAQKRKKYLTELKHIEEDIREISHDLNREKSELINNFIAILNKLFENQQNTYDSNLITSFDPHIKWELVSNVVKINLYRIVQEALQNCNKYADANTITIDFKSEINYLILSISDDGKGFNTKRAKNGIGLHNIQYRAKECKGTVTIKSAKGEGTILLIKVPIDQKLNLKKNDI